MLLNRYRFALLLMALTVGTFFLTTFFVILDGVDLVAALETVDVVAVEVEELPELPAVVALVLAAL